VSLAQCAVNLHKWHLALLEKCQCGEIQTVRHIVEACLLTKLADDGLLQLYSTDDAAIKWLKDTAMKTLAKWNEVCWKMCSQQCLLLHH